MKAASSRKSSPAPRRFDSLAQEVYLNLWRTYDRLKAYEDELFARHELSAQQYNALRLLGAVHPATIPTLTLGTKLISRAPDMTRLLDKLEERGLVWRERQADNRRVVQVGISPAGIELLAQLAEAVHDCHERQLGHLSDDALRQLIDLLTRARVPHEVTGSIWSPEASAKSERE